MIVGHIGVVGFGAGVGTGRIGRSSYVDRRSLVEGIGCSSAEAGYSCIVGLVSSSLRYSCLGWVV